MGTAEINVTTIHYSLAIHRSAYYQLWNYASGTSAAPAIRKSLYSPTEMIMSVYVDQLSGTRTNLAAWIVSNCNGTHGERRRIVDELKKHIPIDIYGECGNKKCGDDCFKQLGKDYKFYLSFENSLCRDYVTEKFFNAIEANMVPLVYGRANYGQQFAPGSFVNVDSFASAKALADYLVYLHRNPDEYIKYFRWRKYYLERQGFQLTKLFCGVCERLHKEYGVTKTNLDIVDWMFKNHSDSLMCNHPIDEF